MLLDWISRIFQQAANFIGNICAFVRMMIKYVKIDLCVSIEFFSLCLLYGLINDSSVCGLKSGLVIQFNLLDDRVWQNVGTFHAHLNKLKNELVKCICTLAAHSQNSMYVSVYVYLSVCQ